MKYVVKNDLLALLEDEVVVYYLSTEFSKKD